MIPVMQEHNMVKSLLNLMLSLMEPELTDSMHLYAPSLVT